MRIAFATVFLRQSRAARAFVTKMHMMSMLISIMLMHVDDHQYLYPTILACRSLKITS